MAWTFLSIAQDSEGGDVVRRPRATDALGQALRSVFDGNAGLPDDMGRILAKLDRHGHPAR